MEKDFNGVLFRINGFTCSIDAMEIREIVAGTEWKPLSVEGESDAFLQIRGKTAKVLDLRQRMGFPPASLEGVNSFIAVQSPGGDRNRLVALWVDMVLELANVPGKDLRALPDSFSEMPSRYIQAVLDYNNEPAYVLKLAEILKAGFSGEREMALKDKAS
jgi:chemotaxis signal transduction protein